jgi:hypothetical protein
MNHEQIVDGVIELLRQHERGVRGSIHQEPYKGDFFRLFAAAFNAGLIESPGQTNYLSADALTDIVVVKAPELANSKTSHTLHSFWSDRTYAWRRHGEFQRQR